MTESNPFLQEEDLEFAQKVSDLKDFAASFSDEDFVLPNSKEVDPRAAQILAALPRKLQEYLLELRQIEDQIKKEKTEESDKKNPLEEEKKRKKREARVEKLAQEIFIISCASNKPMDKTKKEFSDFLDKYNLGKKLNEVGENGLSPVAATMISGKSDLAKAADLEKLTEAGVNISKKDLKNSEGKKSESDSVQREEEGISRQRGFRASVERRQIRDLKQDVKDQEAAREAQRQAKEQQQIIEAGIALEFHQIGMMQIRDSLRKQAAENQKAVAAKREAQEVEQNRIQIVESEKERQHVLRPDRLEDRTALEQILGVKLSEKGLDSMLTIAVQNGQSTLAILLMRYGANVNHKEDGVRTVVEIAAANGNHSLTTILAERANPDTRSAVVSANPSLREMIERIPAAFEDRNAVQQREKERGSAVESATKESQMMNIPKTVFKPLIPPVLTGKVGEIRRGYEAATKLDSPLIIGSSVGRGGSSS